MLSSTLYIPWFVVGPRTVSLPMLGEVTLQPFGAAIWVGLLVGLLVSLWFANKHDRLPWMMLDLAIYLVAFSFPISYLFNGLVYQPDAFFALVRNPSRLLNASLGWSSYGGVIGSITGGLVWRWRKKESLLRVGDSAAFAGPFGWAFGRLGCFMTHDHPGRVTDFFLAVDNYRLGAPPHYPRHDLGFYDLLVFLAIAILFAFLSRKNRVHGFYVALLPLLYAPFRFFFDFLRIPAEAGGDARYAGLTPAQYASVAMFIAALVLLRKIRSQPTS